MLKLVHAGSFIAVDENQVQYKLNVYADVMNATTLQGGNSQISGLKSILTDDGEHVNSRGNGEYEIVHSGKILKKI